MRLAFGQKTKLGEEEILENEKRPRGPAILLSCLLKVWPHVAIITEMEFPILHLKCPQVKRKTTEAKL